MFATGGNTEAARLAGVATDRLVWQSLVASGVIAGFAGVVYSWKVGTYGPNIGPGYLFPAIAAVFFGASQIKGRPNVWGAMIALLRARHRHQGHPAHVLGQQPLDRAAVLRSVAARGGLARQPQPGDQDPTAQAPHPGRTGAGAAIAGRRRVAGLSNPVTRVDPKNLASDSSPDRSGRPHDEHHRPTRVGHLHRR